MVKLTGPGMAKQASGTLAGQLTFSNWKGRAYLKKHHKPKDPKSQTQLSMRAILKFCSEEWRNILSPYQETWEAIAEQKKITPFNAFQAENIQRWRSFLAPSAVYPVTEIGTVPVEMNWPVTCHGNYARLSLNIGALNDGWALTFYNITGPADPGTWHQVLTFMPISGNSWNYFDFYPAESGRYYFAFRTFTVDGLWKRANPRYCGNCILTV